MPASQRIAILVIHGIGHQSPFETLDLFTRGLHTAGSHYFLKRLDSTYKMHHRPVLMQRGVNRNAWQQYHVSLEADADADVPSFDIFECYWAHHKQGGASVREIIDWLRKASLFARQFYEEKSRKEAEGRSVLAERMKEENAPGLGKMLRRTNGAFAENGYLRMLNHLNPFTRTELNYVFDITWLLDIPGLRSIIEPIFKRFNRTVLDYLGDVVAYTTMDRSVENFAVRQAVLKDSRTALENILGDDSYDSVIVAGHSLGSVIAYDTLNYIHRDPFLFEADRPKLNLNKLKGLITFGSPLDKISFYFRQEVPDGNFLQSQMINQLHSYKMKPIPMKHFPDFVELHDETYKNLPEITWLNFYDRDDPVSGHLDVYDIRPEHNIRLHMKENPKSTHQSYWGHLPMYEAIISTFFP